MEKDDNNEEENETNPGISSMTKTLSNKANASKKKEQQTTNKKKEISEFFTPKIHHKTLEENKGIATIKELLTELKGGEGKQEKSSNKLKKLATKTSLTPLMSALKTPPIFKEPAPYKGVIGSGWVNEITQEMAQEVEEGMELVSAKVGEEKDTDQLPPLQIWEKSSNNSRPKASKEKIGTPRRKLSNTTSSTKKTSFAQMAAKQPNKIADNPLEGNIAVVSLSFKILKGEEPRATFAKKMAQALQFIHDKFDKPGSALIPADHVGEVFLSTKTIKKLSDMPKYVINLKNYFYFPNQRSFNPVQQNSRIIKASAQMFFISDPETLLEAAAPDLRNLGCGIHYKTLQEVYLELDHILLGAPVVMTVQRVETELQPLLKIIEKGPHYTGKWELSIKVTKEHAPGMPWETEEENKSRKITAASKQVFIIQVSKKNHGRLTDLLKEIKNRKELHKEWGPAAFTVQIPDFEDRDEQKPKYQQMVGVHISIQMSLGQVLIPGIVDLNQKFSLNRLPAAKGPRSPTLQLVKELLFLMTVGEGILRNKLFTCVAEAGNGVVCGYFSSVDQIIKG